MDKDHARRLYQFYLKPSQILKSSIYKNADLIQFQNQFAVLDHALKQVTYYMVYEERIVLGLKTVYQSAVWRYYAAPTGEIPTFVFFKYLLPIYQRICTDKIQTDLGKGFWRTIVGECLQRKIFIYYIDLKTNQTVLIPSSDEFDQLFSTIWGKKKKNEKRLILISLTPLKNEMSECTDPFGVPLLSFMNEIHSR